MQQSDLHNDAYPVSLEERRPLFLDARFSRNRLQEHFVLRPALCEAQARYVALVARKQALRDVARTVGSQTMVYLSLPASLGLAPRAGTTWFLYAIYNYSPSVKPAVLGSALHASKLAFVGRTPTRLIQVGCHWPKLDRTSGRPTSYPVAAGDGPLKVAVHLR